MSRAKRGPRRGGLRVLATETNLNLSNCREMEGGGKMKKMFLEVMTSCLNNHLKELKCPLAERWALKKRKCSLLIDSEISTEKKRLKSLVKTPKKETQGQVEGP
jgi:hypothetical protein